jgi:hypothetical protein
LGFRALLKARSSGAYDSVLFRKYKKMLSDNSDLNNAALILIAIMPKTI